MQDFINNIPWQHYLNLMLESAGSFTPKFFGAILTLIIGWIVINRVIRLINRFFQRTNLDEALETFLESFLSIGLKIILLVIVASMLGIQTSSLVALMGAAGLAVGLALQGSLSNFAGGVLILVFKPFRIGDYIDAQGQGGTVTQIQIFNTVLKTPDNKKIILPNGNLANDVIINFTDQKERRVDFIFGIGYNDDIKKAKTVLEKIVATDERVLTKKDYEPQIVVGNLGESSVDIWCRVWVKTDDYWDFFFEKNEAVKVAFDKNNISIPFPQTDVHHYYPEGENK